MAMILNLSIGEEIEPEARRLEGKPLGNTDEISMIESSKGDGIEHEKAPQVNTETVV
jgi:hypothetical protein